MRRSVAFPMALIAALAAACAGAPPPEKFEDLPSAETLYDQGQKQLADEQNGFHFFLKPDLGKSIETFQNIIDNYPYSEQAVLAQLAIADAYFQSEKYDEAISYYKDFVELHPEIRNHRHWDTIIRGGVAAHHPHARRARPRGRRADALALEHRDRGARVRPAQVKGRAQPHQPATDDHDPPRHDAAV